MNRRNEFGRRLGVAGVLAVAAWAGWLAAPAGAQPPASSLECDDDNGGGGIWRFFGWRDRVGACEIRELTLDATGELVIDARHNGGVQVTGSDRDDVLVRARVNTWGESRDEARDVQDRVEIRTDGVVRAEGPRHDRRPSWVVSYEVFAPRQTDLTIDALNGGVVIDDVQGDIDFDTTNGGVRLSGLAGDVRGRTTNGGVDITLVGDAWEGAGLDVGATNGGVRVHVPDGYSARFEARTTNGGIHFDFPVTVQGRIGGREIDATLGDGGARVSVRTTNGGVHVSRY